jgi:TRAP-type mannitol/chloroaromatic compound transport system permease large subunit
VIFTPISIPPLDDFGVDPPFCGLLVALNLQAAFLTHRWRWRRST